MAEAPVSIVIGRLADGPSPPAAGATWPNVLHTRVADLVATMGPAPWAKRLIADERQLVTLIASAPGAATARTGTGSSTSGGWCSRRRLEWELTGGTVIQAAKDDIVWVPRGTVHHIRNVGEGLSLRLAVAMPPAAHYYSPCEQCGYADDGPREWRA